MSKLLPFFFLLLCIGCCLEGSAQEYRAFTRRYGIEDGLPHRQVNHISRTAGASSGPRPTPA